MTPYVELCRKKNEVRGRFGGYCFSSREGHSDNVDTFLNDFVNLLDRQAAITQYEWEVPLMKAGHDAVETEREIARKKYEELQAEIAKRDKGIERLKRSRDALKEERDKLMEQLTEARTLPSVLELEEALRERDELKRERALMNDELEELEQERDAYRELCGRFRKMANEMLGVEVD